MKEWGFIELIEVVTICFERELQDGDSIYACSRSFYEYEPVINEGITESIVIHVIIGQLLFKHGNKIFAGQLKLIENAMNLFKPNVLSIELDSEEIQTLSNYINELESCMRSAEVIYQ
jgi:hypothetical protein